ncbi:MAG TPA: RsmE family RNA methyltransferase [Bryobacteraceae bacterium]|jgi:16S rRNA (uracil1498-N3)-methyltransferase
MRRRFFVDAVRNGHAAVEGAEARHLTRVLRVDAGQRYEISDNSNVYLAEIETARKERVVFRVLERLETPNGFPNAILCVALIKFDRFEWMIEKATELGVSEIVPVQTARAERGLERAAQKRVERWRRIAFEASQQSRRARLPNVREPLFFDAAILQSANYRLALDEEHGGAPLLSASPTQLEPDQSIALLIGPEGGWTEGERAAFVEAGWKRVSLGPLILRAETAAIAALAVVAQRAL